MNGWRSLTQEEIDILLPYYSFQTKAIAIFLTIFQAIAGFGCLSMIPTIIFDTNPLFTIIMFVAVAGFFIVLPGFCKKLVKKYLTSLKSGDTLVHDTLVLGKRSWTTHGDTSADRTTEYRVKVNLETGEGPLTLEIKTDSQSYRNLQIGDNCNLLWFRTKDNEQINVLNLVVFDRDYSIVRDYVTQLNNQSQK